MRKKFSLKWGWVAIIGFTVVSCGGLSFLSSIVALNEILPYKFLYNSGRSFQPDELRQYIEFAIVALILFLAAFTVWKRITFTRKDFIKTAEEIGVKFIRKRFYYTWLDFIDTSRFADGFLDDIYVVALMDFPFAGFYYYDAPSGKGYRAFDYIKEKSRILMCFLVSGLPNIDMTIKINDVMRDVPHTGVSEIDDILTDALKNIKYFHAKLVANNESLQMTVIGGSWEGRRFGEKIVTGLEIFKRLNDELKAQYLAGDWKDWQIKWNEKRGEFYLESKKGTA